MITPSDVADWICGTLEPTCMRNNTYPLLRHVYRTLCFFYQALCKAEEVITTAVAAPAKEHSDLVCNMEEDPRTLNTGYQVREHPQSRPLWYADFFRNWKTMEGGQNSFEKVAQPGGAFISLGFYEFVAVVVFVTSIILVLSYVVVTMEHKMELKKARATEYGKTRAKYENNYVVKPDIHWINREEMLQTSVLHLPDEAVKKLIQRQSYLEEYIDTLVAKCKEFETEVVTLQQKYLELETKYKCDIQSHQARYEGILQKLSSTESKLEQTCDLHQKEVASLSQCLHNLQIEKIRLEDRLKPEKLENGKDSANVPDKSVPTEDEHVLNSQEPIEDEQVLDSLQKIEDIHKEAEELKREVEMFRGSQKSKSFLHLEELLIRSTIKLDNVESHGNMVVRLGRKAVLEILNDCLSALRSKIAE